MKKNSSLKMMVIMLCMVLVCSFVPTMTYAASTLTIKCLDVLPGGEGVGFIDNPAAGGSTRGLEQDTGRLVLRPEEWVKYDLSVLDKGTYQMSLLRGNSSTCNITVYLNDEVIVEGATMGSSGGLVNIKEIPICEITISEPNSVIKIENTGSIAFFSSEVKFVDSSILKEKNSLLAEARPYRLSFIPCLIEAEDFDSGLSGVAYSDSSSGNSGDKYRSDYDVDIYEDEGMYYVNMVADDWMNYTIRCDKTGSYDLKMKFYDVTEESKVRLYMDGYEVLRLIPENIMPLEEMKEVTVGTFHIKEGIHTLSIKCLDGDINLDYFRFSRPSAEGIDISNTTLLRAWKDSQELSEDDYENEVTVVNPIEREIYVDASAKINGNGSETMPFNTIGAVKEYVRTVNKDMKGDIVVHLKGEFKVDETLVFNEEDSGTNGFNVIYSGEGDAVIHGGRKVTGWEQVEGSPLWQTTLSDVEDFRQFYIGENRGVRSRSERLYLMKAEYDDPNVESENPDGYIMNGEDFPELFSKPEDMEMIWMPTWRNVRAPIKNITGTEEGDYLVTYDQPYFDACFFDAATITLQHYYYIENAPEFLDRPGEFYFNKDTKVLTYYPFSYEDMTTIDCYIPETEMILNVTGTDIDSKVENITFKGIEFKYGAWERPTKMGFSTVQADSLLDPESVNDDTMMIPAQVQVNFGQNINFYENEFKHMGSNALSFNNTSNLCATEGNLFDDISGTAITVGDWNVTNQDPIEKYTRRITIKNNLIRRPGVEYMTPTITTYYTRHVAIEHNDILDTPYTGVSMGWGWAQGPDLSAYNRFKNNRLENTSYKLRDGAPIYTLGSNTGGTISGNYSSRSGEIKFGVYHDNGSAYMRTYNNVFEGDYGTFWSVGFYTIHDNTAYHNYANNNNYKNSYPQNNNVCEEALGKVNGEWPIEAKEIIENAGVEEEYKYILENYNKKENLRNSTLERQPFEPGGGQVIQAGDILGDIQGGEGIGYHDLSPNASSSGSSKAYEPAIFQALDGSGVNRIMNTVQGEWTKHEFTVDEAGYYDIFLNLSVVTEGTAVTTEVDGGVVANELELTPNCEKYEKFTEYSAGTVYLEPGEHIIKVEHAKHNFGFYWIRIAKTEEAFNRNDGFNSELLNVVLSKK